MRELRVLNADRCRHFAVAEDGPTAVEYALMLAIIALGIVSGIAALGGASKAFMEGNNDAITAAISTAS